MAITLGLEPYDRDILIRTIAGEAANQGEQGWEGVAHTILNRVADDRWGGTPASVALQRNQFSAWNRGSGGNSIPRSMSSDSDLYKRIGAVLDEVVAGKRPDPTGGAVYYYAPGGMPGGREPSWWNAATSERGGGYTTIGGHRFAGQVGGRGTREGAAAQRNADAAAAVAAKPAKPAAMGLSNSPGTIGGRSTKAVAPMGVPPTGRPIIGSLFANAINPAGVSAQQQPQRGGIGGIAGLFGLGQSRTGQAASNVGRALGGGMGIGAMTMFPGMGQANRAVGGTMGRGAMGVAEQYAPTRPVQDDRFARARDAGVEDIQASRRSSTGGEDKFTGSRDGRGVMGWTTSKGDLVVNTERRNARDDGGLYRTEIIRDKDSERRGGSFWDSFKR
jgi:hypothetical protein